MKLNRTLTHHAANSNESHLLEPKKNLPPGARLNFLLGSSDNDLGSFELARLAEVANLRADLHVILDNLIDKMAQAAVAGWFRQTNREALMRAIQSPEEHTAEILAWAKRRVRDGQRSQEELVPRTSLAPGKAHLAASLRYQERNISEGKCRVCPKPLDRNSVRCCSAHLEKSRKGQRAKSRKLNKPPHGRAPGTLAALAAGREKQAMKARDGREPENG
ncbi:MAG: hypothetical protein WAN12_18860 [Candidatus Acidiferrum sp.]